MTNEQLYLAIGVPVIVNMVFNTLLFVVLNARITAGLQELRETMNAKFETAHSELLRVEQVLDASLKHVEEKR